MVDTGTPLSTIEILAIVISGLLFTGTIISGGLLSIDKEMPAFVLRLQQFTPFLTVFATAVTFYMLLSKQNSLVTVLN